MEKDSFEDNMKQLEEVVNSLENGNLSLEEAISTFEVGMKLGKIASEKLDNAEKRINILVSDSGKEQQFEPEE